MDNIVNEEMLLTQEGYDKIVAEHDELVSVKRAEVAERIKEAISYGDISENAEYDSAKNEQAELEERIHKLEEMMRRAKIVQEDDVQGDVVNVGLKVKVKDLDLGDVEEFAIVGATESDPFNGKISNESSVGKSLIGNKVGDKVAVEVPDGIINYEILDIYK
ncbi:MAG: transcription elongation factor GreA [Firmicutes bacterium]|nr:transcription elongation factor GreA [Bacillota bacterium]